jgi:hypothetical protein
MSGVFTVRARVYGSMMERRVRYQLLPDDTVLVYDEKRGRYARDHDLPDRIIAEIRRTARRQHMAAKRIERA